MKRSKFTEQQIIHALRRNEAGEQVKEIARSIGITEATFYAWKKRFAGLGVPELRKLKSQEEELHRLKRLVADLFSINKCFKRLSQKSSKACLEESVRSASDRTLSSQRAPRMQVSERAANNLQIYSSSARGSSCTDESHQARAREASIRVLAFVDSAST